MPLPEQFSEWEHLQDLIRVYYNKEVRQYFKNQPDNDISTPKAALKHGCLHKDNDTDIMTLTRLFLFEVTVGHLQSISPVVYGLPAEEKQRETKFRPQVRLVFKQPYDEEVNQSDYKPHISTITFRLMNETAGTVTRANAEQLARDIKRELATPPYTWEKGWYKYTYLDLEHGYDFRLMVRTKTDGEQLVRRVLSIRNHAFEGDKADYHDHDRTYPTNPGTSYIYGRNRRKYAQRPRVNVKFRHAQLHIHGIPMPINLVSVGERLRSVIEQV